MLSKDSVLLYFSASANAIPPLSPILFLSMLNFVRVALALSASAIAIPPFSPILLPTNYSLLLVYNFIITYAK